MFPDKLNHFLEFLVNDHGYEILMDVVEAETVKQRHDAADYLRDVYAIWCISERAKNDPPPQPKKNTPPPGAVEQPPPRPVIGGENGKGNGNAESDITNATAPAR